MSNPYSTRTPKYSNWFQSRAKANFNATTVEKSINVAYSSTDIWATCRRKPSLDTRYKDSSRKIIINLAQDTFRLNVAALKKNIFINRVLETPKTRQRSCQKERTEKSSRNEQITKSPLKRFPIQIQLPAPVATCHLLEDTKQFESKPDDKIKQYSPLFFLRRVVKPANKFDVSPIFKPATLQPVSPFTDASMNGQANHCDFYRLVMIRCKMGSYSVLLVSQFTTRHVLVYSKLEEWLDTPKPKPNPLFKVYTVNSALSKFRNGIKVQRKLQPGTLASLNHQGGPSEVNTSIIWNSENDLSKDSKTSVQECMNALRSSIKKRRPNWMSIIDALQDRKGVEDVKSTFFEDAGQSKPNTRHQCFSKRSKNSKNCPIVFVKHGDSLPRQESNS